MPEGHTIHRLARDLTSEFRGRRVEASSPQGRFAAGAALLDDRQLCSASAWGKYLFVTFEGAAVLHVHLGLIGTFRARPADAPPTATVRLRLATSDSARDLIGPARCEVITPDDRRRIVDRLGADPLRRRPDVGAARAALADTSRPIGATLLDQSIICGVGNVYRAELLFVSRIHPLRPSSSLTDDEFDLLWQSTVDLMRRGTRLGRIVTTDPAEIGRPRHRMADDDRLYVYHRDRCRRCGSEIATARAGGRPIWFCPTCQPEV